MSDPTNCAVTPSVTFLPESEDGLTPFVLPDGRTISPSGLVAALASLSASQVKALGLQISGIYGLPGSTSSASADLQSCLENKLRARLSAHGSTLYKLTWKAWNSPSAVSRSRLRASAPRTSVTEPIGWPTPAARDWHSASGTPEFLASRLEQTRGKPLSETAFAQLTGWPTPMAGTPAQNGNNEAGNNDSSRRTVALCTSQGPARYTASGTVLTGSCAGMDDGGQLSPEHSRWLMGYPAEWGSCAPTATRSSRKPRPK